MDVNYLLHPFAVLLSFKSYETNLFHTDVQLLLPRADHVLCPRSSLSHFFHRRDSLPGPVCVLSDGTALPRRHVTESLRSILAFYGNFLNNSFCDRCGHFCARRRRFRPYTQNSRPPVYRRLPVTFVPLKSIFLRQLRS